MFYIPGIAGSSHLLLDPTESKHCVKVLRKRTGDFIEVTDGNGMIYLCSLMNEDFQACELKVLKEWQGNDVRPYALHIAVSPLKNPSRFEWFLEKSAEIGIGEITPLLCHRTEKQNIKPERYQNLLISAIKQSGRSLLPRINPPVRFEELVLQPFNAMKYIAWCGSEPKPLLKEMLKQKKNTLILIGPEGDFTEEEVHTATQAGFKPVSLGDARLRTETAALAACFTFNLMNL